jgi:hypothetical protein
VRDVGRQDGRRHDIGICRRKQPCLRLSVEGDVDRERVAFGQAKGGAGKAEEPSIAGVLADDQAHPAGIARGCSAVREGPSVVIAESAADPVADMDAAERPRGMGHRGDRQLEKNPNENCLAHERSPQPPTAFYVFPPREIN